MKYREIIYDNLKSLKQVYATSDIKEYQVLYWVSIIANKFLKGHLDNEFSRTGKMSGKYLTIYPSVNVLSLPDDKQKHIVLPAGILDMDYDKGIDHITYSLDNPTIPTITQVHFDRTTISSAHRLYAAYETPSPERPYFYQVGNKVYFLGFETVNIDKVQIGLFQGINPRSVVSLDEECPLPEHLVSQVKYELINLGRFVMSVPADKVNDGNDTAATPQPKLENREQPQ